MTRTSTRRDCQIYELQPESALGGCSELGEWLGLVGRARGVGERHLGDGAVRRGRDTGQRLGQLGVAVAQVLLARGVTGLRHGDDQLASADDYRLAEGAQRA